MSIRLELLGNSIVLAAALLAVLGRDSLQPGLVGLVLSYATQITQTLNLLIRQTGQIENNMVRNQKQTSRIIRAVLQVSVERIQEYQAGLPQEAAWALPTDPTPHTWPAAGAVAVQGLQLRYRPGLPLVLKGVDLAVGAGQKVSVSTFPVYRRRTVKS